MEKRTNIKPIAETFFSAAIVAVTGISAMYLPALGLLIYFVPITMFITTKRHGLKYIAPAFLAVYILVSFLSDPLGATYNILAPGLPAIIMGEMLRRGKAPQDILLKGVLAGLLLNVAALGMGQYMAGAPLAESLRAMIDAPLKEAIEAGDLTLYAGQTVRQAYDVFLKMIPAILMSWSALTVMMNFFIGNSILKKKGDLLPNTFPFSDFSFSRNIMFGCIGIYFLGLVASNFGIIDQDTWKINLLILCQLIFTLQGMAVAIFFFKNKRVSTIAAYVIVILLSISVIGTFALFILGFLDFVINFRRKISEKPRQ